VTNNQDPLGSDNKNERRRREEEKEKKQAETGNGVSIHQFSGD
jgi:hypothetical protein